MRHGSVASGLRHWFEQPLATVRDPCRTIDLPGVVARSDGETRPWPQMRPRERVERFVSRDLIQDAAQRLMGFDRRQSEVAAVCGAGHGERSPERENQRGRLPAAPVGVRRSRKR